MIRPFLKKSIILFSIFYVIFLTGCDQDGCRSTIYEQADPIPLKVERLEDRLFQCNSVQEVEKFLIENKGLAYKFLDADQYPDLSILSNKVYRLINNKAIDTLYQEVQAEYSDFTQIESELGTAFANIKAQYPDFHIPKVQTIMTGLHKDLYVSDTLIIIGLDFFLGPEATFKPNVKMIPGYMLKRYTKDYITSHIINFIAQRFVTTSKEDNTLLAEMLDYGKSYLFTSQVLPCLDERLIIGYADSTKGGIYDNEKVIWTSLLQNQVLYETDHVIKNKFISERPKVPEIGNKCPGRIGRWIGYRILTSYVDNNDDVTLKEIMDQSDAKAIFLNSKYNPVR